MSAITFLYVFVIFNILGINAVPRDITDFFPHVKGDLTKVTWGHAVNSQERLKTALNSDVMMLEADVVLGELTTNDYLKQLIPIMAHPPDNTSDLSLHEFINRVQEYNLNAKGDDIKKGIKLDFKTIEAFEGAVNILDEVYQQLNFPVWINADILTGPLDAPYKPVDPDLFLPLCKRFENATLSIGWKTRYGGDIRTKYSMKNMKEMYDVIQKHALQQPITLPIRAGIAAESIVEFQTLLKYLPEETTLTLWNGGSDYIDIKKLKMLISTIGVYRVFVDLPKEILDELYFSLGITM